MNASQLHDLAPARIERRQRLERVVQCQQIVRLLGRAEPLGERHLHGAAAALLAPLRACDVDEHAPHEPGRHGEEVGTILPVHLPGIDEPQVGFVDQRRGRQAVIRPLPPQASPCDPLQFLLDQRRQARERLLVSSPPLQQQIRDAAR